MNQILVTQKLYVTPEIKRKKVRYKVMFFVSVFMICILFSYYIYAEYDKTKSEEVSKYILAEYISIPQEQDNTVRNVINDVLIVSLDVAEETNTTVSEESDNQMQLYMASDGLQYTSEAILNIPSLAINYPVLSETSEALLKISLNKYWGGEPNEVGNYCVVGHNYANGKLFGRLKEVNIGDTCTLKDMKGRTVTYEVYDRYIVDPTDVSCTSQLTNGQVEMTLITCREYGTKRLIVKCRKI